MACPAVPSTKNPPCGYTTTHVAAGKHCFIESSDVGTLKQALAKNVRLKRCHRKAFRSIVSGNQRPCRKNDIISATVLAFSHRLHKRSFDQFPKLQNPDEQSGGSFLLDSSGGTGGGGVYYGGYGGGDDSDGEHFPHWKKWMLHAKFLCALVVSCGGFFIVNWSAGHALALTSVVSSEAETESEVNKENSSAAIWEVKDGKWIRYVPDYNRDEFVLDAVKMSEEEAMVYEQECVQQEKLKDGDKDNAGKRRKIGMNEIGNWFVDALKTTMLPIGYPKTVTEDYTEYTLWRMGQIIASQISGVLTTQALLYAVGLGKGAIPTAAAVNWVLKDGIGYLSKIVLSKFGRHFDVHPKGWRLLSDLIEDVSNGLELLTPIFPHLFVPLSAVAGAGKSAAGLIQAATRSYFYAGFAAQHNFAEVIAKGEAQGMVSKSIGIAMGIAISGRVGASGPLLVLTFAAVTTLHVLCNLKSYQAVQLHTLNPYRTGLIMAEYLSSQNILSVRDVNSMEPIFMIMDLANSNRTQVAITGETRNAAADIKRKFQLGVTFGDAVPNKEVADTLFELYRREEYILTYQQGHYKVVLKEAASPYDMLRAVIQASYLQHMQATVSKKDELLTLSYESMHRNFDQLMNYLKAAGWSTDGLVARPAPNRILCKSHAV